MVVKSSLAAADHFGVSSVPVSTNLRETRFRAASWGSLSHGCALAGVGLIFEKEYREILVGSTHTIPDFQPWGSHVLTDPLCSSSVTSIVHDGAACNRVEKAALISTSDIALTHLRVCWKQQAAGNCGECGKCLRTMATLNLLGKLKHSERFAHIEFSLHDIENIFLRDKNVLSFFREILEETVARADLTTAAALENLLKQSRRLRTYLHFASLTKTMPFLWCHHKTIEPYILKTQLASPDLKE